jgi:signal transduction histidine kinase
VRTASIPSERESGLVTALAFDNQGVPPKGGPAQDLDGHRAEKNGGRLALKNWRVRSRLIALIVIPTIAAIVLGGLRVVTSINSAAEYERVRTSAELTAGLSNLVQNLQIERDLSGRFVARGRTVGRAELQQQHAEVDKVAKAVRTSIGAIIDSAATGNFGDRGTAELTLMRGRIDELKTVRDTATKSQLPALPTIAMYTRTINDLLALHDEIIQGVADQELTSSAAAFGALSRAKEQVSLERANLAVALAATSFSSEGLNAMLAARAQRDSELATFRSEATIVQRQLYDDTVSSQKKDRAESIRARSLILALNGAQLRRVTTVRGEGTDQTVWYDAVTDTIERMRMVEKRIAEDLITRSSDLQKTEQNGALLAGGLIALLLILVLIITTIMARSLVRPLRRLRTEALSIAGQRLPETVQSMRETGEPMSVDVVPIGVASDDEIGEVARAFDEVHREAVRLAGQEATLRSNVNSMFVNLSRRSQTLVERQLSLIESLEQGEQDEGRLGSLFRLDHLATRMRRNSENLLVLAGQEPARRWSQPIPLIDVVRASLSEVENYERVNLQLSAGVAVVGTSVNDVVHLIAELVENAISFSPRETKVIVSSNRIDGGGVMVSVTDIGIGMTFDELTQANWRLANPPVVDVSVSRRMGLFVVGRLALRHGIRVQLRQQDSGGLTAMVLLPESLLSLTGNRQAPTGPSMSQSGDWGGSMASMDRPPVMASPTSLDPAQQAFASFEAAQRSFDIGQQRFNSFEAARPPSEGGRYGQNPADTGWPAQVPPPGAAPSWSNTSQVEPGPWPNDPMRSGDSGIWANTSNALSAPTRGAEPDVWSSTSTHGGGSDAWSNSSNRGGDSMGWPSAGNSGAFERRGFDNADNTGPLPVVPGSSPMEEAREEFLPIFAAVESDWFKKIEPVASVQDQTEVLREPAPSREPASSRETTSSPPPQQQQQPQQRQQSAPAPESWSSPADVGWQAAQAASEPSLGGVTGSGLPKRVPKANLVPGTAAPDLGAASQPPMPRPVISPEAVRSRLASFQQGVRQGRAAARGEAGDGQPYPDFGRNVEGN